MNQIFDVAVVGAGVFGVWTAHQLNLAGAQVVLVDAYGPGNSRSSSGGESRIIRMGYGPDEIYTRMAQRSLKLWLELFDQTNGPSAVSPGTPRLFQPTGVLWLAKANDPYCEAILQTIERCQVRYSRLNHDDLTQRFPQLRAAPSTWAILEPDSGVLMARQAVQAVVVQAQTAGVTYLSDAVIAPDRTVARTSGNATGTGAVARPLGRALPRTGSVFQNNLESVDTATGNKLFARQFVFACGPWLPKLFPSLLGELIQVSRQEVFFLGVPSGDDRFRPERMPAWIDFNDLAYGIPNLDNRGFKIAIDAHGPPFDPDTSDRIVSGESLRSVRAYLAQRMPALADAPVTETRVCQYENTSNGDFLIDRHPQFENVWLVGGGSGHGFKHGPAVGEHVAALISGGAEVEPRFALATKEKVQHRKVY